MGKVETGCQADKWLLLFAEGSVELWLSILCIATAQEPLRWENDTERKSYWKIRDRKMTERG